MELKHPLIKQWQQDSVIDATDISKELGRIESLRCRYMDRWNITKDEIEAVERELSTIIALKFRFFVQGATAETKKAGWEHPTNAKILRPDAPMYQAADRDIQEVEKRLSKLKRDLKILDWIMDAIKSRNFVLNKMHDDQVWKGGG